MYEQYQGGERPESAESTDSSLQIIIVGQVGITSQNLSDPEFLNRYGSFISSISNFININLIYGELKENYFQNPQSYSQSQAFVPNSSRILSASNSQAFPLMVYIQSNNERDLRRLQDAALASQIYDNFFPKRRKK